LADRFDKHDNDVKYLDVYKFAQTFFQQANFDDKNIPAIKIEEVTLTDN
jgi:hypothetical protein